MNNLIKVDSVHSEKCNIFHKSPNCCVIGVVFLIIITICLLVLLANF